MSMLRLAVAAAFAVLAIGAPEADCVAGVGQCAASVDHALIQSKSKISSSKKLAVQDTGVNSAENSYEFKGAVPPISTTMKCVIGVTVLYFGIWTSLMLVSLAMGVEPSDAKQGTLIYILKEATHTVQFAPMISVLFIATRMRAIAVTDGDTEKWGLPQWWCKDAMIVSAVCVLILTNVSILENTLSEAALPALTAIKFVADAALYAGFGVVGYGLYAMDTPPGLGQRVPISDTAKCVAMLTISFFAIQIVYQVAVSVDNFRSKGKSEAKGTITQMTTAALDEMTAAPMVCILFLAARMRALQIGLDAPQPWARLCFFTISYSILLLAALGAFVKGMTVRDRGHPFKSKSITVLQVLTMAVIYACTFAVIVSVNVIAAPAGAATPGISTTVRIVMGMTVTYFFVYASLFVAEQVAIYQDKDESVTVKLFEAAKDSVMFCPMLCVLFVGTRMRALQLTHNKGAPQGWAQDCMMLATWAIAFNLVAVIVQRIVGKSYSASSSALVKEEPSRISTIISTCLLLMLHGSVVAVIVSLFLQTPENANSSGGIIPGFKVPGRM